MPYSPGRGVGGWTLAYHCPVCREELVERPGRATCWFCGRDDEAEWTCPAGHHACEDCRTAEPDEGIARVAAATTETDPVAIAERMMSHPSFQPSGPEHHGVPAAALLAALRNAGLHASSPERIGAAVRRTADVPLGACGSRGDCGACVGAGAAVAAVVGADYRTAAERALVLRTTSRALGRLADLGGARCCKQAVYVAIETAVQVLAEARGLRLEIPAIRCPFADRNPDCKKDGCPYHDR
ncbi:MAG: hypothetical protein GYA57_00695 [Myxococcales bacterium]|nr:hypothetical protein [Myxococcales bacterium]